MNWSLKALNGYIGTMDGSQHTWKLVRNSGEKFIRLYTNVVYIGKGCTYLGMDKLYFGRVSICTREVLVCIEWFISHLFHYIVRAWVHIDSE